MGFNFISGCYGVNSFSGAPCTDDPNCFCKRIPGHYHICLVNKIGPSNSGSSKYLSIRNEPSCNKGFVVIQGMLICGDTWDDLDAQVLCKELGFPKHLHASEKIPSINHGSFGYSGASATELLHKRRYMYNYVCYIK